jgi:hypothetical protein
MPSLLWVREYVKATNLVAHTANENRAQSKCCRKSNGAIVVWLKSKNERWTSNNITAHLLISDCSTVTLRGPGPPYGIGYPMASHKFEVGASLSASLNLPRRASAIHSIASRRVEGNSRDQRP